MKPRQLSRTMLAATGFALAALLIAAFAVPTCLRTTGPGDATVIVDTMAPDSGKSAPKTRRDSTSRRNKKKDKAAKPPTRPTSRDYLGEGTRE